MATFSFSAVVKKQPKSHAESSSKYNIIVPGIEGVVFIDLKGNFTVHIGEDIYNIASESYSCKGVSEVYNLELVEGFIRSRYIRSERDRFEMDRFMYLPFTAGCTVRGNIVRHKAANTVIFKIKKVFIDEHDEVARKAIKFYRQNYNTILKAINDSKPIVNEIISEEIND